MDILNFHFVNGQEAGRVSVYLKVTVEIDLIAIDSKIQERVALSHSLFHSVFLLISMFASIFLDKYGFGPSIDLKEAV